MQETIEDGIGDAGIADDLVPAIDGQLAGDDGGSSLVAILDDPEQVTALLVVELLGSPIVEDEQVDPGEAFAALALARGDGRYTKMLRGLARVDLLILDDWGPEKLDDEQRRDLLEIIEDRHERRSTIVTSQLPVDRWYEIIGNPTIADAVLDRLLHNAYRIELAGESLRKRRSPEPQTMPASTAGAIASKHATRPRSNHRRGRLQIGRAAGLESVWWPASCRNRWPASDWNDRPASSEFARYAARCGVQGRFVPSRGFPTRRDNTTSATERWPARESLFIVSTRINKSVQCPARAA